MIKKFNYFKKPIKFYKSQNVVDQLIKKKIEIGVSRCSFHVEKTAIKFLYKYINSLREKYRVMLRPFRRTNGDVLIEVKIFFYKDNASLNYWRDNNIILNIL